MLRIFQTNTVPAEGQQGSTWLELFFDLVYVAILVELGNRLSHDLTVEGVASFAALYVPIFWSWLGLVLYTRYFAVDEIGQRILTVAYMAAMVLLAFEIEYVTGASATQFILAYAVTKFILALMYGRSWREFPQYRSLTSHYAILNLIIGFLWLIIAFVAPTNFWLWGVVVGIDVLTPLFIRWSRRARNKPEMAHPPTKHHYMVHRFGELTIIVLGEFFIKLITTWEGEQLQWFNFYTLMCLLGISVSIWWLYFDHTQHVQMHGKGTRPPVWMYTHYFLLAAITAYGVLGTKVFETAAGEVLSPEKRILFCGALAIVAIALGVIDWASPEKPGPMSRQAHLAVRLVAAALLLLLATFGGGLSAGWVVTLAMLLFVGQVGLDVYWRTQRSDPQTTPNISAG
jgi:low temperature requirement protein LtrA